MMSDEALAFVDLMRRDDLDRRAEQVREATSPEERGDPDHDSVTSESHNPPVTEFFTEAETNQQDQEVTENAAPAATVSEVALSADPLQASFSDTEEAHAAVPEWFESDSADATQIVSDSGQDADPVQQNPEDTEEARSQSFVSEQFESDTPEAPEIFTAPDLEAQATGSQSETGDSASLNDGAEQDEFSEAVPSGPQSDTGDSAEALEFFSENGRAADVTQSIEDPGVTETTVTSGNTTTTFLVPDEIPDFQSMLYSFDRGYHPPDPPAGEAEFPESDDLPKSESPVSSTEHAESMMSSLGHSLLQMQRRSL